MKLPKKIRLGGKTFGIILWNRDDEAESNSGSISHGNQTIKILKTHPDQMRDTLWHEAVHMVLTAAGLMEANKNEAMVAILAHGIDDILANNPDIRGMYEK